MSTPRGYAVQIFTHYLQLTYEAATGQQWTGDHDGEIRSAVEGIFDELEQKVDRPRHADGGSHGQTLQRALRHYEMECRRINDIAEADRARDLQGFYAVAPSAAPDHVDPYLGYIETPDDADLAGPATPPTRVDIAHYIDQAVERVIANHREADPHIYGDGSTS